MSVEEARKLVLLARHGELLRFNPVLERLIVEVQAEMPCYWKKEFEDRVTCLEDPERIRWSSKINACPSCTARTALKVTA